MAKDYYNTLGTQRDCSEDELKKAYRKLAMQYHPDRNPGNKEAERRFKEASEAYAVLSDKQKRAQYDRYGRVDGGVEVDFGTAFRGFEDIFGDIFGGGGGIDELFGGIFGTRRARRGAGGQLRGADREYQMALRFEQAAFGLETELSIPTQEACDQCGGLGARSASDIETCRACGGAGQQRVQQGFFSMAATCVQCSGTGKLIRTPCPRCNAAGRVKKQRKLKVSIPPGIESDLRLKLQGEGDQGLRGGPRGDLYISFQVQPHPLFVREGNNISCEIPITFATASLGGSIIVPTLDGKVDLRIPPGTQNAASFRLRGKGVVDIHGHGRGDHYVKVLVEVPKSLSQRQRTLLEEFRTLEDDSGGKAYPLLRRFKETLRSLFSQQA